jgi:hypothetical protein
MSDYRKFVYLVQAQRRGASRGPWIIPRERWQAHYLEKDEAIAAARSLGPDYCDVWVLTQECGSSGRIFAEERMR